MNENVLIIKKALTLAPITLVSGAAQSISQSPDLIQTEILQQQ